jgi:GNAT superfamily N-acetyltransferase
MIDLTWTIESAVARDLPGINRVLATAINAWTVSERVKRLALPLYHYDLADLEDLHIYKAVDTQGVILGVIAWGAVGPEDTLGREGEALFHGIYVDPAFQSLGIGKSLFEYARQRAEGFGYRGFIVKKPARMQSDFSSVSAWIELKVTRRIIPTYSGRRLILIRSSARTD